MKLTNNGTGADHLTAISSPFAQRPEIHRSVVADGVASMRPVDGLSIEGCATVDFEAEKHPLTTLTAITTKRAGMPTGESGR